jgi:hypothetical protein
MSQFTALDLPIILLTSHRTLGSKEVDIFVGPLREHFSVHEELLCRDAPVFRAMFGNSFGFQEAVNKSADLPEDDPETFEWFIKWLYEDYLEPIKLESLEIMTQEEDEVGTEEDDIEEDELETSEDEALDEDRDRWLYDETLEVFNIDKEHPWTGPMLDRIKLFIFAEKYCIEVLANYAIDTIIEAFNRTANFVNEDGYPSTMPTLEVIRLAYENTLPGSGLRLYLAEMVNYWIRRGEPYPLDQETEIEDAPLPNLNARVEFWMKLVLSVPSGPMKDDDLDWAEIAKDVCNNGFHRSTGLSTPNGARVCYYHRHVGEEDCFTRSRETALLKLDPAFGDVSVQRAAQYAQEQERRQMLYSHRPRLWCPR